jgi:hypothetical protein
MTALSCGSAPVNVEKIAYNSTGTREDYHGQNTMVGKKKAKPEKDNHPLFFLTQVI